MDNEHIKECAYVDIKLAGDAESASVSPYLFIHGKHLCFFL